MIGQKAFQYTLLRHAETITCTPYCMHGAMDIKYCNQSYVHNYWYKVAIDLPSVLLVGLGRIMLFS